MTAVLVTAEVAAKLVKNRAEHTGRPRPPMIWGEAAADADFAKVGVEGSNPFARSSDFFNEINWMRRISGRE
jgi:hypothetical protein